MAVSAAAMPAALERALELFEPEQRPHEPVLQRGVLDLLGEHDPLRRSFAQRTMMSRLVPPIYERMWRPFTMRVGMRGPKRREEERLALQMLALSSGDRVLDLACGPGNFTRLIAAAAPQGLVVGLDASRPMLSAAVRRTAAPNVAYLCADAGAALPFRSSSYDAVSCFGALHLFERPPQALDEIVRVLAPGGRVALMVTYSGHPHVADGAPEIKYGGVRMFARDEITGALRERELLDVEQRVRGRAQFVSARKPA